MRLQGDILFRQGNPAAAIQNYKNALEINPDDISALINWAIASTKIGDLQGSLETLKKAVALADDEYNLSIIYYQMGIAHEKQRDTDAAIPAYEKAIEYGAQREEALTRLGTIYSNRKDLQKALEAFQFVLDAQLDVGLSYRAMLFRSAGIYKKNKKHLAIIEEQISGGVSDDLMARYDLETIRDVQSTNRKVAISHNMIGSIKADRRLFDEAETHFKESLRIWPDNPVATGSLSMLHKIRQNE